MRIRVIQKPEPNCMKGVDADRFQVGAEYEVGTGLGTLLVAKHWAVPAAGRAADVRHSAEPTNVIHEGNPFYPYDQPPSDEER